MNINSHVVYVLYNDTSVRYIGVTNNLGRRLKAHIVESYKKNGKEYNTKKSKNGDLMRVWDYAQQAIEHLGLNKTAICECLTGRQKTAGGFIWEKY